MIIDEVTNYRANYIHDILIKYLPGKLLNSKITFFNSFFIKNPEQNGVLIEYCLEGKELAIHVPDDILLSSIAKMHSWIMDKSHELVLSV